MRSDLAAPLAAGTAMLAAGAASATAAAACAAAAAACTAAAVALAAASAKCCKCGCYNAEAFRRPPSREPPNLLKSDNQDEEEPITTRTLSEIENDETLLPRARAAQHLLHAIAEGNDALITAGILARVGWDAKIMEDGSWRPMWNFAGFGFAQSGAVLGVGLAAAVTAPLSVPSNAIVGGVFAIGQGATFLGGAPGELQRSLAAEAFFQRYGIRKEELKWSLVPAATLYWDIASGDGIFELVFKAKRGAFGLGSLGDATDTVIQLKLRRLLCKVLDGCPGAPRAKAAHLDAAIRKSARDMGGDNATRVAQLETAFRVAAGDVGHAVVSEHLSRIKHAEQPVDGEDLKA